MPGTGSQAALMHAPNMVPIEGGIGVIGSASLDQHFNNCPPRVVRVDSFLLADTCVTVGLQKESGSVY